MKKYFVIVLLVSVFIIPSVSSAAISDAGLLPDSSLYFLKSWKESIQLFFTLNAENKAKQYLHLAEVRLAEYQKMLEKGKDDIAEKTLTKYQNQLNRALSKAEEIKQKGKDIKDLSQQIETTAAKHLEVLQENLAKVPEQAKKGLENAIENSQKEIERVLEIKINKEEEKQDESKENNETSDWKTYRNEKYGFEVKYPENVFTQEIGEGFLSSVTDSKINGIKLVHTVAILNCNPVKSKINCKMHDISFGFFPFNQKFQNVENLVKKNFTNSIGGVKDIIIAGKKGVYMSMGEGGEMWFDYFIPLSNDNTLMITKNILDPEFMIKGYEVDVKDVIDSTKQAELFNQILSTFKFIK